MNKTSIWMRLGISLIGTEEEIDKVLDGNQDTLIRLLKAKSFEICDESYIPREKEDVDFDLPLIKLE